MSEVETWLSECRRSGTRRVYAGNIQKFFTWHKGSLPDFLKLSSKELKHLALRYQAEHENDKANSVAAVVTALSSFASYLDKPFSLRGKRVRQQPDLTSHIFSNEDLQKMFDVACTRDKCWLALGTSLGWEIEGILSLDKLLLQNLCERAKAENKQYMFFNAWRHKTGVPRLGVLNPLALEWSQKWLDESHSQPKRKRRAHSVDRVVSDLFDLTEEGVNAIMRRLAKEANLHLTGRIHFHLLRGWVMSSLSGAGFNEWQIKFVVGKAIPVQDATYLRTLQREIEGKYPKIYEEYLSIRPSKIMTIIDEKKTREIEDLKVKLAELAGLVYILADKSNMKKQVTEYLAKRKQDVARKYQIV